MNQQQQFYDRHQRDPRSKQFYNSADWKRVRNAKLAETPWCERCNDGQPARHVHHRVKIATPAGWEARLDPAGLMSLCIPCHNTVERQGEREREVPAIAGMLEPEEDEQFYFDEAAAERPLKFIRRYIRHYEGHWAGQLFEPLDWQCHLVRTLYGWKHRGGEQAGRRRFTNVFLLSAKGAGKTPLMASIGAYELMAASVIAPHVVSMASDFKQATLTFEWAKRAIEQEPALAARCQITFPEIRERRTKGKWNTFSGKNTAKSGFRPNVILADEAHEWQSGAAFDSVTQNVFKRREPIIVVATNAGRSQACYAWTLYEDAKAVLAGDSRRTDLLPAIFEATEADEWTSEQAARKANPSIPDVVSFASVLPKVIAAQGNKAKEAEYRRLHLSQWNRGGATAWLDMAEWDAAAGPIDPEAIKDAPLYVGLDLSMGDDLCAAALVWLTPERLYVDFRLWIPRTTAEKYQDRGAGRYSEWAEAGHITLLDDLTIGPSVRKAIASEIVELAPHAVCYDRYKANEATNLFEAEGIKAIPIGSGWGTCGGCEELERRLKEGSVTIAPNAVARTAAEHAEIEQDKRGNFWVVKPNAKGKYAGTRSAKIDPIVALTIALVEARRHEWAATNTGVCFV